MQSWITVFFLFLFTVSYSQSELDDLEISDETEKIVKDIKEINVVMNHAIGIAGMRPAQYDNFVKLQKTATTRELKTLTDFSNPTVRCYAFWALSLTGSVDLFPILLQHISDTAKVQTQFGCIVSREYVGDFFVKVVTPQYIDRNATKLDSTQRSKLDSILIYNSNDLNFSFKATLNADPTQDLYPKIRELVINEHNHAALVTLAKYQKEKDIPLILQFQSPNKERGYLYVYKAIQNFPHPEFLPLLEKNLKKTLDNTHYSQEWKQLYKAIANYRSEKAEKLLLVPFTQVQDKSIRKYHIRFIFKAVKHHKSDVYEDLLWKLWEEEGKFSMDIIRFLSERNSQKVYQLIKKSMIDIDDYYINIIRYITDETDSQNNMISFMLDQILEQDKELAFRIIKKNIKKADGAIFSFCLEKVAEIKYRTFVDPLFQRLRVEDNAHRYLDLVKVLIEYNNSEINRKILEVRKKNNSMNEGWGSEALDKLLAENNIK